MRKRCAKSDRTNKAETGRVIGARFPTDLADKVEELSERSRINNVSVVVRILVDRAIRAGLAQSLLDERPALTPGVLAG